MSARIPLTRNLDQINSGGGVVCRPGPAGLKEILLVHRPRFNDWTLPKGKVEPGECAEEAAVREVEEETGLRCVISSSVACTTYEDRRGREKTVCYWLMEPVAGAFRSNDEVDELRWLTVEEALDVLSHERERNLLKEQRIR